MKYPALNLIAAATVKKGEAERSVAADAVQPVLRNFGNLVDGVGGQVGKLLGFKAAPHLLNGLEVRGTAWEALDTEPRRLSGDPISHASAVM